MSSHDAPRSGPVTVDGVPDPWTTDDFVAWLAAHAMSPPAMAKVRRLAHRHGVGDQADDLRMIWFTRLLVTMHNKSSGGTVTLAICSTDEAAAYAYVALVACAKDLRRQRQHLDVPLELLPELTGTDESTLLVTSFAVERVRAELDRRLRSRPEGRRGCASNRCVLVASTVVEIATRGGGPASDADPRGGTDEWDRLLYRSLDIVMGDGRENGERDPARRQMKLRCGRCARELLAELFRAQGLGPVPLGGPAGTHA